MRNSKGFTVLELVIVLAIIGILCAVAYPTLFGDKANGANFQPQLANDQNIAAVADLMKQDTTLKVKLMTHLANWTHDGADVHIDQAQVVEAELRSRGITKDRIIPFYSNKDGLNSTTDPVIPGDGVYLLLTY